METTLTFVCDCGSRVFWLGEDDLGRVAALGSALCVIDQTGTVHSVPYVGVPIAFIGGLCSLLPDEQPPLLLLGDSTRIPLPSCSRVLYDAYVARSSSALYFLTKEELFMVFLPSGRITTVVADLMEAEEHGRYEALAGTADIVVAYRYGAALVRDGRVVSRHDERPYSDVAFLPDGRLLAVHEREVVHTFDITGKLIDEYAAPPGIIYFAGSVCGAVTLIWQDSGVVMCWTLVRNSWRSESLVIHDVECVEAIPDHRSLAICTVNGTVLFWDVDNQVGHLTSLPVEDAIYKAFWSSRVNKLFLGTRGGLVYSLDIL
jgi:hypothetical protein